MRLRDLALIWQRDPLLYAPARYGGVAEAKVEIRHKVGLDAPAALASIDAVDVAVDVAVHAERFTVKDIKIIHARLMAGAVSAARLAGVIRTTHNWLGGNDYICLRRRFSPITAALNQSASR